MQNPKKGGNMPESPSFNLSGIWLDGSREITIAQSGNAVRAEYVGDYECDPQDGSPIQKTKFDFEAKLENNRLEGEIMVCTFKTGGRLSA